MSKKLEHVETNTLCDRTLRQAAARYQQALADAEAARNVPAQREILHRLACLYEAVGTDRIPPHLQAALAFTMARRSGPSPEERRFMPHAPYYAGN